MMSSIRCLLILLAFLGNAHGEIRGIDVDISREENKKVIVSIKSAVGDENQSELTVNEAAKILEDAKGWGSSVIVSFHVLGVSVDRYLPLIQAVSENPWLNLSSINGQRHIKIIEESPLSNDAVAIDAAVRNPADPLSEENLLKAAKTDPRARHFLADLWRRGRLSAMIREQIVTQHLHFTLKEEFPHDPARFPTLREIKIIAETDFPFPESAWVQFSSDIAVGDRDLNLGHDDFSNSRSLHMADGRYFGSLGGSYSGAPEARSVIQFREISRDGKVSETAWLIRRETKSIRLENRTKVEQTGADQPATAPESKPKGNSKPQLESERRSQ